MRREVRQAGRAPHYQSRDGRSTLVVDGDLDIVSAPKLEREVIETFVDGAASVVLDLSRLEFIDSSGIRAILRCLGYADAHNRQLTLIPGREAVQRVFALLGLDEDLPFAP